MNQSEGKFRQKYRKERKTLQSVAEHFQNVSKTLRTEFPHLWTSATACLSTIASLAFKDIEACSTLVLISASGSGKSSTLEFFTDDVPLVTRVDTFTAASFVSQYPGKTKSELAQTDLLAKVRGRVLVTRDLTGLFSAEEAALKKNIGMLTQVLDGKGHVTWGGAHGERGYEGDYAFVWLGATPKVSQSAWKTIGAAGSRFLFLRLDPQEATPEDLFTNFGDRKNECASLVRAFIAHLFDEYAPRSLKTDQSLVSPVVKHALFGLADFVRHARGNYDEDQAGEPEAIFRPAQSLRALAVGMALLHGRTEPTLQDLRLLPEICLSSMPHRRSLILRELVKQPVVARSNASESTEVSAPTARKDFRELEALSLGHIEKDKGETAELRLRRSKIVDAFVLWKDTIDLAVKEAGQHLPAA